LDKTIKKKELIAAYRSGSDFFLELKRGLFRDMDGYVNLVTKINAEPPNAEPRWRVHQVNISIIEAGDLEQFGTKWRWVQPDADTGEKLRRFHYGFAETLDGFHRIKMDTLPHINWLFTAAVEEK